LDRSHATSRRTPARWSTRVNGFVFYHDLRRQGGLRPALDTALQQIGSALRVEPMDGPFAVTCEVVSAGDRSSQDLPSVWGTGDAGLFTYQVCAPGALVPLGSGDADHAADLLV
jgi:hypothetical protein